MSEWISVEKIMPDLEGQYLVAFLSKKSGYWRIKVARFNRGLRHKTPHFYGNQTFSANEITHWMPLPEPPTSDIPNYDA